MEYISSKNIFLLLRDTLKLIDRKPMDHGSRVGYIMCKMLECKGGYEQFELADFLMLATLHDIGVYKTDKTEGSAIQYEFKNPMPHSTYGFLFLKHITPLADKAKMVLHHRTALNNFPKEDFEYKEETEFLELAEAAEIYHSALGKEFDYRMFRKQEGVFYSKRALDYLDIAVSKYDIFSHIEDESYQKELDALLDYMIFTNEDKKKFMEVLMYCIGFRSDVALVDAVTSLCVSLELAKKLELSEGSSEKLYYGSLVHDIGMLSVPASIIEAPRKLTDSEIVEMRTHVEKEEKILLNRLDEEIVSIATMHHERLDGSGYPKGLKGSMMSKEQFIVQIADVVTGLTCERSYRKSKSKDEVIKILKEEGERGKLDRRTIEVFIDNYDDIMQLVSEECKKALETYQMLNNKYGKISEKISK